MARRMPPWPISPTHNVPTGFLTRRGVVIFREFPLFQVLLKPGGRGGADRCLCMIHSEPRMMHAGCLLSAATTVPHPAPGLRRCHVHEQGQHRNHCAAQQQFTAEVLLWRHNSSGSNRPRGWLRPSGTGRPSHRATRSWSQHHSVDGVGTPLWPRDNPAQLWRCGPLAGNREGAALSVGPVLHEPHAIDEDVCPVTISRSHLPLPKAVLLGTDAHRKRVWEAPRCAPRCHCSFAS